MRKRDYNKRFMFRDFLLKSKEKTSKNTLHNIKTFKNSFCKKNDISFAHLEFLFWAYNYEFFTISHASKSINMTRNGLADRYIYPLTSSGYLFKYFDRLTKPEYENQLFREDTKFNYRVRYAISQKGINLVDRFYRDIDHLP
jgi:hypothetical protein